MSAELIGILSVGVGLTALALGLFGVLLSMIKEFRMEVNARFEAMDLRLRAVEHGMAKLEGLLEGLREAITVRSTGS